MTKGRDVRFKSVYVNPGFEYQFDKVLDDAIQTFNKRFPLAQADQDGDYDDDFIYELDEEKTED